MNKLIFHTSKSPAPLLLRVFLALVIFPHGAQKLFGWFGGFGFGGSMSFFTDSIGLPWILGFLIIVLESFGALMLLVGFATRLMAILFTLLASGIIMTSHWEFGFFMNWFGSQAGEGFEYFLLWIGMSLSLIYTGGGQYSIDERVQHRLGEKAP